ncbi:hypothetical protein PINS_up011963 [Pythium insidiosum]|nr:hypothetical protein PINS_up011963 [Pythium insidiosum]
MQREPGMPSSRFQSFRPAAAGAAAPAPQRPHASVPLVTGARYRSDSALHNARRESLPSPLAMEDHKGSVDGTIDPSASTSISGSSTGRRRRTSLPMSTLRLRRTGLFDATHRDGFWDIFGALGVPMVAFFLCSALALLNQAAIQLMPTRYANALMNTTALDHGDFWLFEDAETGSVVLATCVLVFFAAMYVGLVVFMVCCRHRAIKRKRSAQALVVSPDKPDKAAVTAAGTSRKHRAAPEKYPELSSYQLLKLLLPMLLHPQLADKPTGIVDEDVTPPEDDSNSAAAVKSETEAAPTTTSDKPRTMEHKRSKLRLPGVAPERRAILYRDIYRQFFSPDGVYHAYYVCAGSKFFVGWLVGMYAQPELCVGRTV